MRARLLVVDDEKEVRELLTDILTSEDHEVETCPDGHQGLKMFKHNYFDLVFTDLGMPGMTGWQVAAEVKKINGTTPVSVITGWSVKIDPSEMKERGVDFIVSKPFEIKQILQLVQDGLQLKQELENNNGNESR